MTTGSRAPAARRLAAGILAAWFITGCTENGSDLSTEVQLLAAAENVPFSGAPFLLLRDESEACVVDSYEHRVTCGERGWKGPYSFGREGKGPGEYDVIFGLANVVNGGVAVIDYGTLRLTWISGRGQVEGTLPIEGEPWLVRSRTDSVVRLTASSMAQWTPRGKRLRNELKVAAIDAVDRSVDWRTLVLPDSVGELEAPLVAGAWSPEHGFVFLQYPYRLYRFSPEGAFLGPVDPEHYEPEFPSDRDVKTRASDLTKMFGRRPPEAELREYRQKPKRGVVDVKQIDFDDEDLLWVGTTRDHVGWSYLDVYTGGGSHYLGSVRVRDRLLAFDVVGNTLAVLVERLDRSGLPSNAIDWYDTTEWRRSHSEDERQDGAASQGDDAA